MSRPENDNVNELSATNGESHQLHHAWQTINFKVRSLAEDLLDNKSKIKINVLMFCCDPFDPCKLAKCLNVR